MSSRLGFLVIVLALVGGCGETFELESADMSAALNNGGTCSTGNECSSGHCVDGVCCESACNGVCEACNLPGKLGSCEPIADGVDPAMECMPKPIEMVDGGTDDGGTRFNVPDAGFNAMQGPCAPTCNGKRACGFPGASVKCGDDFCNTNTSVANAICDGEGHCSLREVACVAYTCGPNACKTSCASSGDCQPDYFCNLGGTCQQKKAVGVSCGGNPEECDSGYCADGVCCGSNCAAIPSGQCNNPGFVGTCKCTVGGKVCDGTCDQYYPDGDGDGYGKINGTPIVGCTADPDNDPPPPAGYVLEHTDCDDAVNAIHPNAAENYGTTWPSVVHNPPFDWDCNGTVEQRFPVLTGYTCAFCSPASYSPLFGNGGPCGGTSSTSAYANQRAYLNCSKTEVSQCSGGGFCIFSYSCGLGSGTTNGQGTDFFRADDWAYISGGACGGYGTIKVCGSGAAAGTTKEAGTSESNLTGYQQWCK